MTIPGLHSAQASHDAALPAYYYAPDETTDAEALEALFQKAAAAARDVLEDGVEVEVSPHVDDTSAVTLRLLGVRYENKRQAADTLMRIVAYLLSTERK